MTQTLPDILRARIAAALAKTSKASDIPGDFVVSVTPTNDPQFGDYQSNAAMVLAKSLKTNPRGFAAELVEQLLVDDLCETPEIAGPGFLNFRLKDEVLAQRLVDLANDERLGVPKVTESKTIVIDFSAPNVAKPMHVGHIRSTFIGDCLARVSRFLGHNVITDNHIGDWGTQFGMIIYGWKNLLDQPQLDADPLAEFLRLYKNVNATIKDEGKEGKNDLLTACREELVKLQQGNPENRAIWETCVRLSLDGLDKIYERLGVEFDHHLGESFFNDALQPLVDDLLASGVAVESEGAICIFSTGEAKPEQDPFKIQKDGEWRDVPAMIRKSDGGFLYATTDIATVDYRVGEWKADEIWYVVGAEQQLHLRQVFEAARRRGHTGVNFVHVSFGGIFGKDRKRFRTRSGESVGLVEVLNESIERASAFVEAREEGDDRFTLLPEEKPEVARVMGLGSVKYAELSQARMTDYIFDWDKMLSLKGATAPYLINAYVRTRSIFRKYDGEFTPPAAAVFTEDAEKALAMKLVRYGEIVPSVLDDHKPSVLATYLYELASLYHSFFQACHVLKSEGATRESRLLLCEATSRVLKHGLTLLGIETTERM